MYYPSNRDGLNAKIQAPFVLAELRALRSSIFKGSPEVRRAIAIADEIERSYDLSRADLFLLARETFCAVLEPFADTLLAGTMQRVGYEIFPQYVSILGVSAGQAKAALALETGADLIRRVSAAYGTCVVGPDAGALTPELAGATAVVTDTTFMPCQLQMGVFLGAGKLTGLLRKNALVERRCRSRGDAACVYDFSL